MHMGTDTDALGPGIAGETEGQGGTGFPRCDREGVGWWVTWLLLPLPSPGTKPSGLSSSCWVWGPCSPGIFS